MALILAAPAGLRASPWAETGDRLLRSDIEVLQNYGVIRGPVMSWPIPWAQVSDGLAENAAQDLPPYVRRSLERVRARLQDETRTGAFKLHTRVAVTSEPAIVRDFGRRARRELDTTAGAEYMWSSTAARLNLGYQNEFERIPHGGQFDEEFVLDDSYVAQEVGNWLIYAGALDQWWGPGWITSLMLSNNARPIPRVGFMRNDPKPFANRWLSWIGPWQLQGFAGVLEGDRDIPYPILAGGQATITPFHGHIPGDLEISVQGLLLGCGEHRPCNLKLWADALVGADNTEDPNSQLGDGLFGLSGRYTGQLWGQHFSAYLDYVSEDLDPAGAATAVGLSTWGPLGGSGAQWRFTSEFANTLASDYGISGYRNNPNLLYEHFLYTTGLRHRGRSIGASVDNDTWLYTAQASLTDVRDWTYRLTYHRADINRDNSEYLPGTHTISHTAELIDIIEAELSIPWRNSLFDFALRYQDDKPNTPGRSESDFAAEARWQLRF